MTDRYQYYPPISTNKIQTNRLWVGGAEISNFVEAFVTNPLSAGTGLELDSNNVFSIQPNQPEIIEVGTLNSLNVAGTINSAGNLVPVKSYVDGISYITAGSGITKTGSTISLTPFSNINISNSGTSSLG